MVAFLVFGPLNTSAQAINHAPVINSKPATTIQAGAAYSYLLTAFDSDSDAVSFKLTTQPEGMTLTNATIAWQPAKVGTYNVVAQASDPKNGFDSQAWQITVTAADVATVIITPNDRPTVVAIGQNKQFTVAMADAYENAITNQAITWTTDSAIGTVTSTGLFTPTHGGTGFVAAQAGTVKASVGVVAKDSRTEQVSASNTNESSNANSSGTAASIVNNANKNNSTNVNSSTNTNEAISADTNTNAQTSESAETQPCANPNHKLIISILIIYAIVLAVYYTYERRHKNGGWWIFPFLATFIGVIIYYKYFCADTYLWWPWVLVGIGVVLTLYYKLRRHSTDMSQTELPF
ncbi:MAG: hypothetical protein V1668_03125 [Patescibacteria group bacterium]